MAETIYSPVTFEPLYEYQGIINENTVFKSGDFKCTENATCRVLNLFSPLDYETNLPLDGFDFWAWERGRHFPKKSYKLYTFLVKRRGQFVWEPYSGEYIDNLMGN